MLRRTMGTKMDIGPISTQVEGAERRAIVVEAQISPYAVRTIDCLINTVQLA